MSWFLPANQNGVTVKIVVKREDESLQENARKLSCVCCLLMISRPEYLNTL